MNDELRDLYQEVILDHGRTPRNFRHPADANHEAHGHNPLCGDRLTVYLTLDADGTVKDAAFEGRGCAISTASASLMTEVIRGKAPEQVKVLFEHFLHLATGDDAHPDAGADAGLDDEMERLEVLGGVRQYPMRVKCATLAWHTLNAALESEHKEAVSTE